MVSSSPLKAEGAPWQAAPAAKEILNREIQPSGRSTEGFPRRRGAQNGVKIACLAPLGALR
jgi:hypothetical protein